jgi:hypothetical protein
MLSRLRELGQSPIPVPMRLKRTAAVLLLAAIGIAGCGGDDGSNEKRFDGESKEVAAVVDRLQEYARDSDGSKICSELMTPRLGRFIAESFDTTCEARVNEQLGDEEATITIRRLRVDGPLASATVAEESDEVTGMAFVKRDGEWRISRIRG